MLNFRADTTAPSVVQVGLNDVKSMFLSSLNPAFIAQELGPEINAARALLTNVLPLTQRLARRRADGVRDFSVVRGRLQKSKTADDVAAVFLRSAEPILRKHLAAPVVPLFVRIAAEEALKVDLCRVLDLAPTPEHVEEQARAGNDFIQAVTRRVQKPTATREADEHASRRENIEKEIRAGLKAAIRAHDVIVAYEIEFSYPQTARLKREKVQENGMRFERGGPSEDVWDVSEKALRAELQYLRGVVQSIPYIVMYAWKLEDSILHGGPRVNLLMAAVRDAPVGDVIHSIRQAWCSRTVGPSHLHHAFSSSYVNGPEYVNVLVKDAPTIWLLAQRFASSSAYLRPGVKGVSFGTSDIRSRGKVDGALKKAKLQEAVVRPMGAKGTWNGYSNDPRLGKI